MEHANKIAESRKTTFEDLKLDELQFKVLPCRPKELKDWSDYIKSYQCWKEVWCHAFQELGVDPVKNSDSFTKHDEVNALYYRGECAGLITFKWIDLNNPVEWEDSYFAIWPQEAKDRLKNHGNKIILATYLTVNFPFRRNAYGLSWKDLLIALIIKRLEASHFNAMVAAPRITKSSQIATYRHGAEALSKDVKYPIPNETVDLIIWDKKNNLKSKDQVIQLLADHIWQESTTFEGIDNRHQLSQFQ